MAAHGPRSQFRGRTRVSRNPSGDSWWYWGVPVTPGTTHRKYWGTPWPLKLEGQCLRACT